MTFASDEGDYVFVPLDELISPAGGTFFQHFANCWWTVHPEKGAAFYNRVNASGKRSRSLPGAPQCNSSEEIALQVSAKYHPWAEVRLIESAWVPVSLSDYQN